jgi:hypothetical protein
MALINTTLTTSAANIYASSGNSVVVTVYLCNTDTVARTVSLFAVPAAGTASGSNQIIKDLSIAPSDTYIMNTERLVLANGEMLQANCNVNSVITATVSYTGV